MAQLTGSPPQVPPHSFHFGSSAWIRSAHLGTDGSLHSPPQHRPAHSVLSVLLRQGHWLSWFPLLMCSQTAERVLRFHSGEYVTPVQHKANSQLGLVVGHQQELVWGILLNEDHCLNTSVPQSESKGYL